MKKTEFLQIIRESISEIIKDQSYVLTFLENNNQPGRGKELYAVRKFNSISEANESMKKVAIYMTTGPDSLGENYTVKNVQSVEGSMIYSWPTEYYTYFEVSCPVDQLGDLIEDKTLGLPDITSGDIEHLLKTKKQKVSEIIAWYKGPSEKLGEELSKKGFTKSQQSFFKNDVEIRIRKPSSVSCAVDVFKDKQLIVTLPDFDKVARHLHPLLRDHRGNFDPTKVADLADRLASKEKVALKEVIRTMLREQVLGQSAPTSKTLGATTSSPDKNGADRDSRKMSDSDAAKMTSLQTQQGKLTNDIRNVEGQITKLQEPVQRQVQKLELKKSDATKKLGSITTQIEDLNKKYGK